MRVTARSPFFALITIGALAALSGCEGDQVLATHGKLEMKCCTDVAEPSMRVANRVDFAQVQVGIVSSRQLIVKNVGDALLSVSKMEVDQTFLTGNWEFKLSETSFTLAPNQEKIVTVSFQPFSDMTAPATTQVKVVNDSVDDSGNPVGPVTLTLSGQGIRSGLEVTPNPVDFENVLIGSHRELPVIIKNNLSVPVDVVTPVGTDGKALLVNQGGLGRFELLSPVSASGSLLTEGMLAAGASIEVMVKYTPDQGQEGREEHARWTLSNCANPLCEVQVTLKGTGTNSAIVCAPPAIDFGDVNPNNVVAKTTTCRNIATESVTVTRVGLAPGAAREYSVDAFLGGPTIVPDGTFDVTVRFAPTLATVGQMPAGFLLIEGRNPNANRDLSPTRIALSGGAGGPDIAVTPLMFSFGQIAIGTSGKKRVLIENTGYDDLVVSAIDGDASRTGVFSVNMTSYVIPRGASEILEVSFTPTADAEVISQVIITSNDADETEVRLDIRGIGITLPPCQYTRTPTSLNFGIVQIDRSTTQGFRIQNTGTDDCLINDVEITANSDPVFGLLEGNETGILLHAGETKAFILTYTPDEGGIDSGDLGFYISDPLAPNVEVPLHGTGTETALLVSPNEVDFGRIGVDCSTRDRAITVFNTGANSVTVTRIERPAGVSAEFQLDNLPPGLPAPPGATIVPGQSIDFVIRYHADDIGIDTGFIHMYVANETDPYVIPVYGEGATDPINEDRYTQLETPEVDILWVIDNSGSMSEEQTNLIANFRSFIQFADSQALDYHLSVVSTDIDDVSSFGACPNPLVGVRPAGVAQAACGYFADGNFDSSQLDPNWRIVSPDEQPSAEAAFSAIANQGVVGSGFEQPLQAAFQALSPPLLNGWNDGFLRQSAYLAVIIVTDEMDQSPQTVDIYTNFFLAIKGFRNTQLFSLSAITGDSPGGCFSSNGSADDGARLLEVVRRTGGIFESICTADWSQALQNLGLSVFGYKSRFFLSNQPVGGSVVVTVDGDVVEGTAPSGQVRWNYDPQTNSVNFAPLAIPEPGSEIVITYTAECL